MNQRDTALASLWDRTYRAAVSPDSRGLFDEAALGDARQLLRTTNPATDVPVAHALGWFHWLRYLAQPEEDAMEELAEAIRLLTPVFELNPHAVPQPLQRWYLQTEASSYADGSQPWPNAKRLPIFRATVRSTIDRAPANQSDRIRFLLDTALMLRHIAGRSADEAVQAAAAEMTLAAVGRHHARLPSPTGNHMAVTLQALLEPVIAQPVAMKSIDSRRELKSTVRQQAAVTPASPDAPLPPQPTTGPTPASSPRPGAHERTRRRRSAPASQGATARQRRAGEPTALYAAVPEPRRDRRASSVSGVPASPVRADPRLADVVAEESQSRASEQPRHLWANFPDRVGVGQRIPLLVGISLTAGAGATAPLRPFTIPDEGRRIVVAISAPGFELLSDADQELIVPASRDSDPLHFALRAIVPGLHRVKVDAFASGTFLGRLELQVSAEVGAAVTEGVARQVALSGVSGQPGQITLQVNREGDVYSFQLMGTSVYRREPTRSLAVEPTVVVERILGELRTIARGESGFTSPRAIRERIRNLGTALWSDIVPDSVRRQFWEQADSITSFVVMSNLDMIPWELLHPVDHGRPEIGFLAEHVPVVRGVYDQPPVLNLPLSSSAYVVPPKSPSNALAEVSDVRAVIGQRARDLGVISRLDDLQNCFRTPPGLLHFACHNTFSPSSGSTVGMDGGPVHPDDLEQSKRRLSMAGANPLIFFNACRTAGEIYGFTQLSGWASQFMAAGAGAFVGTLWPVRSETARIFATSFYTAIVHQELPLGEATLLARKSVSEDLADPTWLAYSVYGSPNARVQG